MPQFLAENGGTIIIGLALAAIVALIVIRLVKNRRKGKCCGCDACARSADCCKG